MIRCYVLLTSFPSVSLAPQVDLRIAVVFIGRLLEVFHRFGRVAQADVGYPQVVPQRCRSLSGQPVDGCPIVAPSMSAAALLRIGSSGYKRVAISNTSLNSPLAGS